MRLLFAHDHRFLQGPEGRLHSVGSFPASAWDRYLRHFDEVRVLARDGGALPGGAKLSASSNPSVDIEFVPSLSSFANLLLPSPAAMSRIRSAVAESDAVVVRLPSEIGLRAAEEAHRIGKPYAIEVVGCAYDAYAHNGKAAARLYAPLAIRRMRRAIARAPLALYVTSSWLQNRYPTGGVAFAASNVEIVPLDEAGRASRDSRLAALVAGRPPQLGTVASLSVRTKGVQTALAALGRLRRAGVELRYALLGAGPVEPWLELARKHGVADLVRFDGTREAGEGVRRWLDGIDIHLQPSFQEGLPRATIEAMSRGVACIGSTCGGIPELLTAERTHRPGDVAGLADCIRRLALDPAAIAAASRIDLATSRAYEAGALRAQRDEIFGRLRALADAAHKG